MHDCTGPRVQRAFKKPATLAGSSAHTCSDTRTGRIKIVALRIHGVPELPRLKFSDSFVATRRSRYRSSRILMEGCEWFWKHSENLKISLQPMTAIVVLSSPIPRSFLSLFYSPMNIRILCVLILIRNHAGSVASVCALLRRIRMKRSRTKNLIPFHFRYYAILCRRGTSD